MPGWMAVPTVEFGNRKRKTILHRHILNLALEVLKLRYVLNSRMGYTQHRGQHICLSLREGDSIGESSARMTKKKLECGGRLPSERRR